MCFVVVYFFFYFYFFINQIKRKLPPKLIEKHSSCRGIEIFPEPPRSGFSKVPRQRPAKFATGLHTHPRAKVRDRLLFRSVACNSGAPPPPRERCPQFQPGNPGRFSRNAPCPMPSARNQRGGKKTTFENDGVRPANFDF